MYSLEAVYVIECLRATNTMIEYEMNESISQHVIMTLCDRSMIQMRKLLMGISIVKYVVQLFNTFLNRSNHIVYVYSSI